MIIMALDHVRAYFHRDAFLYDPTDIIQTSVFLFFTRYITTVYLVWIGLVLFLYPCCKWFDRYKRARQSTQTWLSYL